MLRSGAGIRRRDLMLCTRESAIARHACTVNHDIIAVPDNPRYGPREWHNVLTDNPPWHSQISLVRRGPSPRKKEKPLRAC